MWIENEKIQNFPPVKWNLSIEEFCQSKTKVLYGNKNINCFNIEENPVDSHRYKLYMNCYKEIGHKNSKVYRISGRDKPDFICDKPDFIANIKGCKEIIIMPMGLSILPENIDLLPIGLAQFTEILFVKDDDDSVNEITSDVFLFSDRSIVYDTGVTWIFYQHKGLKLLLTPDGLIGKLEEPKSYYKQIYTT
jgi:hypothetical protein